MMTMVFEIHILEYSKWTCSQYQHISGYCPFI